MVAATATVPPTDTISTTSGTSSMPTSLLLVALVFIGATSVLIGSTVLVRRTYQD